MWTRPVQGPHFIHWNVHPSLPRRFTGESDSLHPQWVVVNLRAPRPVNAVRIAWASPYATTYRVEYWAGKNALDFDAGPQGEWKTFPIGKVTNGQGGAATLKLTEVPVSTQYLRIWMTESSNTCDVHGPSDIRKSVGYAIHEMHPAVIDAAGVFTDTVTDITRKNHPPYTSPSSDPWHSTPDANTTHAT